MTHKQKLHLARTLMTQDEIKAHVAPFQSTAWGSRKDRNKKKQQPKKIDY